MEFLSLAEFEKRGEVFDQAVAMTPGVSTFCCGIDWQLAAHAFLHPARDPLVVVEGDSWVVFAKGPLFDMPEVLQPMEAAWCFSFPAIGKDWKKAVRLLCKVLHHETSSAPLTIIGGVPVRGGLEAFLRRQLAPFGKVLAFPGTDCARARLDSGLQIYLSRRSSRFRAGLRAACRRASQEGIQFEYAGAGCDGAATFTRLLEIESRTWKFASGASIFQMPDHKRFYRCLFVKSAVRGHLRAIFAVRGDTDVAYAVGGVIGKTYRGLQMGYDDACARLALGNLV
jgi:hypothetical protein